MISEKRKYARMYAEMPVTCFVVDGGRKKRKISYEVISNTVNISKGGCCLSWPKSWKCKSCSNCVAWVFNHNCKLKKENFLPGETDRYLSKDMVINIKIDPPAVPASLRLVGKVVWANPQNRRKKYEVGVSFLESCNGKLETIA